MKMHMWTGCTISVNAHVIADHEWHFINIVTKWPRSAYGSTIFSILNESSVKTCFDTPRNISLGFVLCDSLHSSIIINPAHKRRGYSRPLRRLGSGGHKAFGCSTA